MADYAFRTLEDRQKIQQFWENGLSPREISAEVQKPLTVIYAELKRGQDGVTRLEDGRLKYDAKLAQRVVNGSLERRGRKTAPTERAVNQ